MMYLIVYLSIRELGLSCCDIIIKFWNIALLSWDKNIMNKSVALDKVNSIFKRIFV